MDWRKDFQVPEIVSTAINEVMEKEEKTLSVVRVRDLVKYFESQEQNISSSYLSSCLQAYQFQNRKVPKSELEEQRQSRFNQIQELIGKARAFITTDEIDRADEALSEALELSW